MTRRPDLEGAHLEMEGQLNYGEYLHLDAILGAQHPRTDAHDEVLFIIQHQATEVWFKLILHELRHVMGQLDGGELRPAFKGLSRIERIMLVLNEAWDILTTLTPADYSAFRDALGQSSGFQSYQYREFEFLLGNRDAVYLGPFRHLPEIHDRLVATLHEPSLYDHTLALLAKRGLPISPEVLGPRRDQAVRGGPVRPGGLAGGVLGYDEALGPVRVGRGARGPRGGHPSLAIPPRDDRRTGHRRQARDGRDAGRAVPARSRRDRPLP